MPAGIMTGQYCAAFNTADSPNDDVTVVPGFGDPFASIVINRGEDIECGKDTRDGETQHPDCQVTSGTNPVVRDI